MCVLLSTSPLVLSELWCGGVLTLHIDNSRPKLCSLMLHSLLIEPTPLSLPAVQCTSGGGGAAHSYPTSIRPSCCCTGSSAHPGLTFLLPSIPKKPHPPPPRPSLPEFDSSSPPSPPSRLPNSRRCCSLAAAKIYFNMAFSCCSSATCHQHSSRIPPPPLISCLLCSYLKDSS